MGLAEYTYYLGNLSAGTISGALPFKGVSYAYALNTPGSFSATLNLSDPAIQKMNPIFLSEPAKTALWIDRGGVLVWGGIIWGRQYDSTTYKLSLSGSTFDSYGSKRFIDYAASFSEDEIQIAVDLWTTMQATAHGNINCPAVFTSSGNTVSQQWQISDYKKVTDGMKDLTNQGTFDYTVNVSWNNGVPSQSLVFGAPHLGRTTTASGLQFSLPGNILSYTLQEDGGSVANRAIATGTGSGADQLTAESIDTSSLSNGYPVLDEMTNYKDVTSQTTLNSLAASDLALYTTPVTQLQVIVRGDQDPAIGSYILGDYCLVNINDWRFPSGFSGTYQIRGISVAIEDSGVEKVTLSLYATTARRQYGSSFEDDVVQMKNDIKKLQVGANQFTLPTRNQLASDYASVVSGSLTTAFQMDFPYKSPRVAVLVGAYQTGATGCAVDLYDLNAGAVLATVQNVTATSEIILTFTSNSLTFNPATGLASVAIRARKTTGTFNVRPVWAGNLA